MRIGNLTIVGVGLIGGSIGLAAKRRGLAERVIGVGRQMRTLENARDLGAIDEGSLDVPDAVRAAELAVFCTPVDQIVGQVLAAAPGCAAGTLLTDAGSTKAVIVRSLEGRLPDGVAFVGSHPLAGSEKRGSEHAAEDLFEGRLTIVTRTPQTGPEALDRTMAFWRSLGAQVRVMDPEAHDQTLAVTSHLPHLVAAALAGLLPAELQSLTATGFRDTTRVAAGDPALWTAIFAQNRGAVLAALDRLEDRLERFRAALRADDQKGLHDLLSEAKRVRDALGS
jgi:cyclohexadieny/prephenate dehydrogenase